MGGGGVVGGRRAGAGGGEQQEEVPMRTQSTDPTGEPSRGPRPRGAGRARRAVAVVAALVAVLLLASCSDPVPSAGASTMSLLFVQNSASGTFEAAPGAREGELRLTGVAPTTTWFSDRPARRAGVQSTQSVTSEWDAFGFGASPPNAALVLDELPASANTVIVELRDPRYDAAAHELRYRVHMLDEARDGLAGAEDRATPQIPASFGAANLFIDDATVTAETTTGSALRGTKAPQTGGTGPTTAAPTTTTGSPTTTASPTTAPSSACSSTLATFAAAAQAGTYSSPAQSIAFPTPVTLQNPATQGSTTASQTVSIPFVAYDTNGTPVSPSASAPLTVSIYGAPAGSIQTTPAGTGTSPLVVTLTSGSALSLTYNGAYLTRPVTVAASLPLSTTNVCTNTPEYAIGSTSLALATVPIAVGTVSYSTPTACSSGTTGSACAAKNVDSDGLRLSATVGYGAAVPGSSASATPVTPTGFANYTVDTGSIGTALPKTDLGPDAIGPGGPALKYYDSSGNEFVGYVYLAPVTLQMGSVQVTTDPIRVLAVMSSDCHPNKTCTGPPPFADFHYLGVGLDRSLGTAADPFGSPRDNALLSVGSTSATLSPGYVLSGSSIQVGITASNATSSVVPLTANTTDPGDWNAMPMCVTFPTAGATSPAPTCGSLLMDVGIPEMFITFGSAAAEPAAVSGGLADNQTISIAAPNQTSPAFAYSFSSGPAGGATPPATGAAPSKVVLGVIAGPDPVFINTGRHVLFDYQYVFNAQAGTIGFVPLNPPLR
jgi:hypothetical protein